jgi:hypothetical protein
VSRLRKEVIKEVASRWAPIGDVGENGFVVRCVLFQKCLDVLVPLVPLVPFSPPLCFVWSFTKHSTMVTPSPYMSTCGVCSPPD